MQYEEPQFFRVMEYTSRADHDVVDMVSANPDWAAPPALSSALREYADLGPSEFQYAPSDGLRELREEIAARRNVDVEQVVVTNGAGEANYLGMARALERDAGDEVLLTDPVYPYFPGKTRMLGGTPRYVAADDAGRLDPADVRAAATEDTACIVVNSPNNPTGAVYGEDVKRELVAVAEEYDALLVSDETYDHFDYSGRFTSALDFDSSHRVVCTSFSKSLAITGFRVGYCVVPHEHAHAAKARHMLTNVSTTRPGQYAVLHALRETDPEYYRDVRALLEDRIDTFTGALADAGVEHTTPEGGFYVMARFPGVDGTLDSVFDLIDEAGVAGMPGESFGDALSDWVRFALVTPRVEEAAERLADYAT